MRAVRELVYCRQIKQWIEAPAKKKLPKIVKRKLKTRKTPGIPGNNAEESAQLDR